MALKETFGEVSDWFRAGLRLQPGESVEAVVVSEGERLPSARDVAATYCGVLISGSVKMVTDRLPWSENAAVLLRDLVAQDTCPVLGVCYGHQLLAHALGGTVDYNVLGRSLGTFEVQLTKAAAHDVLFGAFAGRTLRLHASHMQHVVTAPSGSTVLATNGRDPNHALKFAPRVWGFQFHPEFSRGILSAHISARRAVLVAEGKDPDAMLANTLDSPDGGELLARFAALCRGNASLSKL